MCSCHVPHSTVGLHGIGMGYQIQLSGVVVVGSGRPLIILGCALAVQVGVRSWLRGWLADLLSAAVGFCFTSLCCLVPAMPWECYFSTSQCLSVRIRWE